MAQYDTLANADDYFANQRLNSELWFLESEANRNKALIQATRLIDNLNFIGEKFSANQELEFPRNSDAIVPSNIKHACFEIAFALLDGSDIEMDAESSAQRAALAGNIQVRKDSDAVPIHILHSIPSAVAWRLLLPYLRPGDTVTLSRVD